MTANTSGKEPAISSIAFPAWVLAIRPYLLGAWIGGALVMAAQELGWAWLTPSKVCGLALVLWIMLPETPPKLLAIHPDVEEALEKRHRWFLRWVWVMVAVAAALILERLYTVL